MQNEKNNAGNAEKNEPEGLKRVRRKEREIQARAFAEENVVEWNDLNAEGRTKIAHTIEKASHHGLTDAEIKAVALVSLKSHLDIDFDKNITKGANGALRGDTIYLSSELDEGKTYHAVLLHEMEHYIFRRGGGDKLMADALRHIDPALYERIAKKYKEYYSEKGYSLTEMLPIIDEEIATAYGERVMESEKAWEYILADDPKKADSVIGFFRRAAVKYSELQGLSGEARAFAKAYEKMFRRISETGTASDAKKGKEVLYDLRKGAREDVEKALADIEYREDVFLTECSPSIIASQKGVRNLPMLMKASHIRENVFTEEEARQKGLKVDEHTHYHGLGMDFFLQIIDGLDDVTLAYRGTKNASNPIRRENYFLLISQYKDSDKNTINVPVYIDEMGQYNRVFIDTNKLATVFGRQNFMEYIKTQIKNGDLVRIKNKSIQTSERAALIADGYSKNASTDSIHDSSEKVNRKKKKSLSDERKDLSDSVFTEEERKLLFDEEFYEKYKYESKEPITERLEQIESLINSKQFESLSEDEQWGVYQKRRAVREGYMPVKLTPEMILGRGRSSSHRAPLGTTPQQKKRAVFSAKFLVSLLTALAMSAIIFDMTKDPTWATISACGVKIGTITLNGFTGFKFGYENICFDTVNYMADQSDLMEMAIQWCEGEKDEKKTSA